MSSLLFNFYVNELLVQKVKRLSTFNYSICWPVLNDSQPDHDFHLLLFLNFSKRFGMVKIHGVEYTLNFISSIFPFVILLLKIETRNMNI